MSSAVTSVARLPLIAVGDSITQKAQAPGQATMTTQQQTLRQPVTLPRLTLCCCAAVSCAASDGWLTLLSHWYVRRVDVFNRGYSGYNSAWLHALLRQQSSSPDFDPLTRQLWTFALRRQWKPPMPDALSASSSPPPPPLPISALYLLCIGANDAMLPPASVNKQHVSLPEFRQHVEAIVDLLLTPDSLSALSRVGVVLITPPATDAASWAAFSERREGRPAGSLPLLREQTNTQEYAAAVLDIAKRRALPAVDLFSLTVDEQNERNRFLSDGLHLSPAGNAALFRALLSCIAEAWPQLDIAQLPMDAPFHLDINNENVSSYFS